MSGSANTFQLTIRGVIALAPQGQEVADFVTAMRLCCELYLAEEKPRLTSSLLQEREPGPCLPHFFPLSLPCRDHR